MPTARFWEMEDARIDFGSVDAPPHDLGRLMMLSYATAYGNDWYVVPVRLLIGTLCRVEAFTVFDVLGGQHTIGPVGVEGQEFHLFALTDAREPSGASPWFLLAPALPGSLESPAIESVLVARDKMANLAWAIEQRIEDPAGGSFDRYDAMRRPERREPAAVPAYHVDTPVPEFWFPVAPEQLTDRESVRLRLVPLSRRDAAAPDGVTGVLPLGVILAGAHTAVGFWLHEEEVPRSGVGVTRSHQRARWHDGSVHAWTTRRKGSGTGGSSSGLRFDAADKPGRGTSPRQPASRSGTSTSTAAWPAVDISAGFDRWTMPRALHESFPALLAFGARRQPDVGKVIAAFQAGTNELVLHLEAARWISEFDRFPVARTVRLDVATGAVVEYPTAFGAGIYVDGWRRYRTFYNEAWDVLTTVTKKFIASHQWTDSVFRLPGGDTVGLAPGATLGVVDGRLYVRPNGSGGSYRIFDLDNLVTDGIDHGGREPIFPIPDRMTRAWSMTTDPDSWYARRPGGEFSRDMLEAINTTALETGGGAAELLAVMNAEIGLRTNAYHPAGRYGLLQMSAGSAQEPRANSSVREGVRSRSSERIWPGSASHTRRTRPACGSAYCFQQANGPAWDSTP